MAQLVEALRYKPEGRGFDSRWPWGWPGIFPWGGGRRPVRKADNLAIFIRRLSWNLGALTSWNLQGLFRPVMGLPLHFPFLWRWGPTRAMASSILRFLNHTQRRITVGSTPLLWMRDQCVAETSTWQHTTLTTDRRPWPQWDSNP